jgi:hypothetical protein
MRLCRIWFAAWLLAGLLGACGGGDPPAVPTLRLGSQSGLVAPAAAWNEELDITGGKLFFTRTGGSQISTGAWSFDLSHAVLQSLADRVAQINATADADKPVALMDVGSSTLDISGVGMFYDNQFIAGKPHSFSDKLSSLAQLMHQQIVDRGLAQRLLP